MKVELINTPTEITDESLKQYLADCSSVVRNAQPKDNERLFARLLKESFGNKASRVFEYIPCKIELSNLMYRDDRMGKPIHQTFGFFNEECEYYYTNVRELLNWGWSWEEVIEVVDFTHYKAVKCTAPYFIYGQVSTHTQITSVSHSNRYTESNLGYWMPDEFILWYFEAYETDDYFLAQDYWDETIETLSILGLRDFMKDTLGITRREVYARGADMLQYRVFCLGGYTNNPNGWEHFINQRLHDPHTQKETRELTAMIEEAIK